MAQKKEILVRVIRAFVGQTFSEDVGSILSELDRSCDGVSCYCCEHRERAVRGALVSTALGLPSDREHESATLSQKAELALQREVPDKQALTVLKCACNRCAAHICVTNLCQNCEAKPCINSCKFGAIQSINGRSIIDDKICKKCGLCVRACPYGAIVRTIVPCENACPVKAIGKAEHGCAEVDFDKCIGCGKCILACPFNAIQTKSQVVDVLRAIKSGKTVIALIAPSLFGQFSCSAERIHCAIKKIGFSFVYEVAIGAEITSVTEANELRERLERGDKFMTSSCCAAYNALINKHIGELKPFVSTTKTPAFYTAELVKKEHGDAILVFVSPCLAKYGEVFENTNISYAINFEELDALFIGLNIDINSCAEEKFAHDSAKEAKEFPLSGGVSDAVLAAYGGNSGEVKVAAVDGLTKETIDDLKRFGKTGECERGNMIEVMSCPGGCLGGGLTLCALRTAQKQLKNYSEKSDSMASKEKNVIDQ